LTQPIDATGQTPPSRGRLPYLLPLTVFGLVVVVLGIGLTRNPREVPSPLVGKPVPAFDLPAVQGRHAGLATRDLVGQVALVNVFASWCTACLEEHPVLVDLARRNVVAVHGLNYKDKPDDAARWLDRWGDPYTRTGADVNGQVGIDWGVYGVPETFVIDRNGLIAYKHIGALTPEFVKDTLLPLIDRLKLQRPKSAP
jgi:cytochrome c biogenesis protein CcmG, thiol:disulfide interchange protein DsbE